MTTSLGAGQYGYYNRSAVIPDHCLTDEAGGTTESPYFPAQQQAR